MDTPLVPVVVSTDVLEIPVPEVVLNDPHEVVGDSALSQRVPHTILGQGVECVFDIE